MSKQEYQIVHDIKELIEKSTDQPLEVFIDVMSKRLSMIVSWNKESEHIIVDTVGSEIFPQRKYTLEEFDKTFLALNIRNGFLKIKQ